MRRVVASADYDDKFLFGNIIRVYSNASVFSGGKTYMQCKKVRAIYRIYVLYQRFMFDIYNKKKLN